MTTLPSLVIGSGWRETLNNAFATLRRINFITKEDFTFTTFNPQLDFQGMTVTGLTIRRSRYSIVNKILWYSVSFTATLAAPFGVNAYRVYMTIPGTTSKDLGSQSSTGTMTNAGVYEIGIGYILAGTNQVSIFRSNVTLYTAGAWEFTCNGYVEII